jgi:hypothetical protein
MIFADSAPKAWRAKMQDLAIALSETVPFLYPDPTSDGKQLTEKVKRIKDITSQLDGKLFHSMAMSDNDPALPYIAGLLKRDIDLAYLSLQEGHTDYAKSVVRNSIAYCIACHTRTKTGVQFPLLSAFDGPLKKASWIDKIEFQSGTRQFDSVLTEVMQKLDSPGNLGISTMDLERASRIALSIAVRVKQDPARAKFLAAAVVKSASATEFMKERAKAWSKDIGEWQDQKSRTYDSDGSLITAARSLIYRDENTDAPMSANSEVRYLRASVLMHDLLRRYPKSPYTAEAFYIIGRSYDSLGDIGLWSLHEMYFTACIDKAPHTKLAEQCFERYADSITLGFTGSRGTNIPRAVRKHLDALKETAQVKTPESKAH